MRSMNLADIDAVFGIEQAVQAYPWTRGNFQDAMNNGYVCNVEEQDGEVRGYAILMPVVDEAELLNIGVAEKWQRKGVGRSLLHGVLNHARDKLLHRIFLEVRPGNAAGIALYRCAGFSIVGVRRDYYQNQNGSEDALVMALDLNGERNEQA